MTAHATIDRSPESPRRPANGPSSGPIIGRINAVFFRFMDWYAHWKYAQLKRRLFRDLPDAIVELGAGAGANFRYFAEGTRVITPEPNVHMHSILERKARSHGIVVDIRASGAEKLDIEDESVEAVVCSLVLCTVRDPARALREALRVLKPGGRFLCIEHVAAPAGSFIGRLQRWVFRPWQWFFEGCHTHRDTASTLRSAGFSQVSIEPFTWRSIFLPVRPQIVAVCIK
jgi:ubiquinone/menaquinone biosynthesis C-methylase UbiE